MKILLASGSPRRLELLQALGHEVLVKNPNILELEEGDAADFTKLALENSRLKAEAAFDIWGLCGMDFILAADTIVTLKGELFLKPRNKEDAQAMLARLSGHTHQVITAFCLIAEKSRREGHVLSSVKFRSLSTKEISSYVELNQSLDKSGAYGVQGPGASLIDNINGSISNIIGLPISEVLHEAKLIGLET